MLLLKPSPPRWQMGECRHRRSGRIEAIDEFAGSKQLVAAKAREVASHLENPGAKRESNERIRGSVGSSSAMSVLSKGQHCRFEANSTSQCRVELRSKMDQDDQNSLKRRVKKCHARLWHFPNRQRVRCHISTWKSTSPGRISFGFV